jgi:hypothetical protein
VLFTVVLHFAGVLMSSGYGMLVYLMVILALVMGVRNYRDTDLGGYINYGHAFGTSMLILVYGAIVYGAFMYLYYATFGADQIPVLIQQTEEATMKMMEKFDMDESKIEEVLDAQRSSFTPPRLALNHAGGVLFWGGLIALITSAFVRRKPELTEPPMS